MAKNKIRAVLLSVFTAVSTQLAEAQSPAPEFGPVEAHTNDNAFPLSPFLPVDSWGSRDPETRRRQRDFDVMNNYGQNLMAGRTESADRALCLSVEADVWRFIESSLYTNKWEHQELGQLLFDILDDSNPCPSKENFETYGRRAFKLPSLMPDDPQEAPAKTPVQAPAQAPALPQRPAPPSTITPTATKRSAPT